MPRTPKPADAIVTRSGTTVSELVLHPFEALDVDAGDATICLICLDGVGTLEERGASYLARPGLMAVRLPSWHGRLTAGQTVLRAMRFAWPRAAIARLDTIAAGLSTNRTLYGRSSVELAWRSADELRRRMPLMMHALGIYSDGIALGLSRYATNLGAKEPARAQRARRAIEKRYKQPLDLAGLAREQGCTAEHLSRLFKQTYGFSPNEFLLRFRVERSRALLSRTNRPVADIALELGFHDGTHFARHFRKIAGMSPVVFRARQRDINSVRDES